MDKNSMLYWHPKVWRLPIPQPRTIILVGKARVDHTGNITFNKSLEMGVRKYIESVGLPAFLRTDLMSHKHDWINSCFVKDIKNLKSHMINMAEFSFLCDMIGRDVNAFVVRKYIPMRNLFTAFYGDMPVNPEIRFFVKNGQVLCYHWYWIEEAIADSNFPPSAKNWREIIAKVKAEPLSEKLLDSARLIAETFKDEGYWSADFCQAQDLTWYLIDMALGVDSWHPENCLEKPGVMSKLATNA